MRTLVLNALLISLCGFLLYHAIKTNIQEPDYTYSLFEHEGSYGDMIDLVENFE